MLDVLEGGVKTMILMHVAIQMRNPCFEERASNRWPWMSRRFPKCRKWTNVLANSNILDATMMSQRLKIDECPCQFKDSCCQGDAKDVEK